MHPLISCALVLSGTYELFTLLYLDSHEDRITKLNQLAHKDWMKMSDRQKEESLALVCVSLLYVPFALFEFASLVVGMVCFSGPMRWLLASVLGLGFVTGKMREWLPASMFKGWMTLDFLYCSVVLILGTLYFQ